MSLCQCGCGRETKPGNIFIHGHNPVITHPIERFWSYVDRRDTNDCWEWKACRSNGYGITRLQLFGRHKMYSHRAAYILTYGSIPENKIICHRCNNPACCNPMHLYAGSYLDNLHDSMRAGTAYVFTTLRGELHPEAKLTDDKVRMIRTLYAVGDISQRQLARQFGVARVQICRVIRRETWTHVQ